MARSRWPRELWWLLPPVVFGTLLRLWNLGAQVLSDDETHAVRAVLGHPLREILVTYQLVDHSIPLSALYRFLIDCGLRPSELTFRMPALAAGVVLLAALPPLLERRLGLRTAIALAWLLALSPGLVFYSRIARSYLPMTLLGCGAAVAFEVFWRGSRWRPGIVYATLAAGAAWLHLGAATFVLAPLLYAAGDWALGSRDRRQAIRLGAVALLTGLAFLAFLLPARDSLVALIQDKHQALAITWPEIRAVLKLQAGTASAPAAALFWLAAAAGLVRLARVDRRLAAYSSVLVAGHVAGLLVLSPAGHEAPLVLNRYLLVSLPVVLVWVAVAIACPWPARSPRLARWGPSVSMAALLAALALTGPFTDRALWRSAFAHADDYLAYYTPRPEVPPEHVPGFYRRLARSGDSGPVIEFPWLPVWRLNRAFYLYQEIHGQEVLVASARPALADPRLAFRNMIRAQPELLLASRGRWLVVHRNLGAEENRIRERVDYWPLRIGTLDSVVRARFWRIFRVSAQMFGDRLTELWGRPDFANRHLRVWDLARVRRELAASGAP